MQKTLPTKSCGKYSYKLNDIADFFILSSLLLIIVLDHSISVYDADAIGKFDAVGHALFYITDALTHGQKSHTLKLYRQSMVSPDIFEKFYRIIFESALLFFFILSLLSFLGDDYVFSIGQLLI